MLSQVLLALATASAAAAHGGVLSYKFGSTYYGGFVPYNTATGQNTIQRQWATYNPLTTTTDPNLACNNPGTVTSPSKVATVTAGTSVTAYWNNPWPHTIGPVMVYMANCGSSCSGSNPASLEWFKIDESGLISGTVGDGYWGMGKLVADNSSWTSTIPSNLPNGNYMIRHELLAIHSGADQPQFYPECAMLTITGGGSGSPGPTVVFPGGYSATDPSITIDVYANSEETTTTYAIPGPAVWT